QYRLHPREREAYGWMHAKLAHLACYELRGAHFLEAKLRLRSDPPRDPFNLVCARVDGAHDARLQVLQHYSPGLPTDWMPSHGLPKHVHMARSCGQMI